MAGTREILYSLPMATKFPTKPSIYTHFNRQFPCSNYLPYDSGKRLLVQPRKVVVAAATPIKAAAETEVQCQVKAVVTVKCGSMDYVKDMVFRWLDSEAHRARTGVVLQLVSTQVDPSKHLFSRNYMNFGEINVFFMSVLWFLLFIGINSFRVRDFFFIIFSPKLEFKYF